MIDELKKVLQADEVELFRWMDTDNCVTDLENYAYWEGTGNIMLQAHVDTVHKGFAQNIVVKNGVVYGKDLGADDRAGVYVCFELRKRFPNTPILLTSGEEIGGIGMDIFCEDATDDMFSNINLAVAIDRQGIGDYVTYNALPKPVGKYANRHGWHEAIGSFSDIEIFTDTFKIPSINVSCGYYNQHTKHEILLLDGLTLCIQRIARMLENPIHKRYVSDSWGIKPYGKYQVYDNKYYSNPYSNYQTSKYQGNYARLYNKVETCPYCKSNNVQDYKDFYYCNECGEIIETYQSAYNK